MAEFFDWDRAEQAPSGLGGMPAGPGTDFDFEPLQGNQDFDLALANVDGDDFSFWALEHFETSNLVPRPVYSNDAQKLCDACEAGGFNCKRKDGSESEACTTCVALNINCSFSSNPSPPDGVPDLSTPPEQPVISEHTTLQGVQLNDIRSSSSPDFINLVTGNDSENDNNNSTPPAVPKIGARFSRESVRILKAWLSTHSHRPYPNDEERENLQRQTGLNKTQIANWLANARRRSKQKTHHPTRSKSPSVRAWAGAVEIPQSRGGSSRESEYLSPLQRWQNSPPENEPACVTAIASAVMRAGPSSAYDSGLNSPFNNTDDDAVRSGRGSSASSFGTSPSSASFASAYSQGSRSSIGSLQQRGRRRRRRRVVPKEFNEKRDLNTPLKTFQCTFCTETFRTKHDWQRHEKSLHLSLEQWICCPKGPRALNPDNNQVCCVFDGVADPDNAHIESHNYTSCQERSLEERTFYRKDHLRQHLKLVHGAKFNAWAMNSWKAPTPDIRSRCGFCGVVLNSWPARVDHLAEHFKTGSNMVNWKGDWGFEPSVLSMVENAIPPYLIHDDRATPLPFKASQGTSKSPRNAYELIKLELADWLEDHTDVAGTSGTTPSDEEILLETCRIIHAAEARSQDNSRTPASWFRDVLMSSEDTALQARLGPLRSQAEGCLLQLRVHGKDNVFEDCPLERQLLEFVKARSLLGLTATNDELQVEACNIVGRMEESSILPLEKLANLYLRLIYKDTGWLSAFRQRAGLLPMDESVGSTVKVPVTASIQDYTHLETELADFANHYWATMGTYPSDEELRTHARCVVYKCQDGWQQTAANNAGWLESFKQRHFPSQIRDHKLPSNNNELLGSAVGPSGAGVDSLAKQQESANTALNDTAFAQLEATSTTSTLQAGFFKQNNFFLNPASYRRLAWELGRFVTAAMSPNNPNQHVPTDEELKHQARWILYDDDDPLNHTAADNAEWLLRFKRSVGILPATDGEGLPEYMWKGSGQRAMPWQGTTPSQGASPDAMIPSMSTQPMQIDSRPLPNLDFGSIEATNVQHRDTGSIFASPEFEDKLVQFAVSEVASSGRIPPDEAIQARAKELLGFEVWQTAPTPAEDPVLLAKFKKLVVERVTAVLADQVEQGSGSIRSSHATSFSVIDHTPDRGQDAIDPSLLPALDASQEVTTSATLPTVHVAISEKRLEEIIDEALQR
ncbi:hypothetical protein N0V93_007363 [Gnomoniopsis smithogilvyi]|uniref:Uncharacterized protein n=1 Tax=Gnomoniopsis smithogilvyi TaxID=1191159 RepID=A0A9W8YSJ7_9PEZI|nr:hypothetical protein N0V93_007363 [Gnomoniopsis smithogilvyi]